MKTVLYGSSRVLLRLSGIMLLLLSALMPLYSGEPSITGFARNRTGVMTGDEFEYSSLQNMFALDISHTGSGAAFLSETRFETNFENEAEFRVKQLYVDLFFEAVEFRIGKQQIIWGKGDGVFITDIVSPKDMSEFILPDFDEIRTGVTAVKTDFFTGSSMFELVWVPVFTPAGMPGSDSMWHVQQVPEGWTADSSGEDVSGKIENSEIFFRHSYLGSAADYEIVAGWMWDDEPSMEFDKASSRVFPEHNRVAAAGGSFSYSPGSFVLRGDGAFYAGKHFTPLLSAESFSGDTYLETIEKNYLHYMAGIDWSMLEVDLSFQFIQQSIPEQLDQVEEMTGTCKCC